MVYNVAEKNICYIFMEWGRSIILWKSVFWQSRDFCYYRFKKQETYSILEYQGLKNPSLFFSKKFLEYERKWIGQRSFKGQIMHLGYKTRRIGLIKKLAPEIIPLIQYFKRQVLRRIFKLQYTWKVTIFKVQLQCY